jgi:hypothetical protein
VVAAVGPVDLLRLVEDFHGKMDAGSGIVKAFVV